MNLIFFIHTDSSENGETLKRIMRQMFDTLEMEVYQSFNSLKAKLKQASNYSGEIFILLAESKSRLNELTSLVDLMDGRRILLILPDESELTISMAHQFFPRYFTFVNETYQDLCDVLIKMVHQEKVNAN